MVEGPLCGGCPNQPFGQNWIPADGGGSSGILFLGDSPWKDEQLKHRNFSGPAGYLYEDKWLSWLGLKREQVTTANSLWCSPPRLGWTDAQRKSPEAFASLQHCRPYLDQLVAERRPKVIVPMGNVALSRATGLSGIEKFQGYVLETEWGIPAVATFHPSYVMSGKYKLSPVIVASLRRAQRIANGTVEYTKFKLLVDPPIGDLRAYVNQFPRDLVEVTTDIETPYSHDMDEDELDLDVDEDDPDAAEEREEKVKVYDSSYNIIRGGFSLEPGVAVSFPFEPPYIEVYFDVLARAGVVWEWSNRHFDSTRLAVAGAKVRRWGSAMMAWHFLQSDLPKALGFVAPLHYVGAPWKNKAAEEPAWYNAMDNAVQELLLRRTREALEKEGRWYWFNRHCVETDEILVKMCEPGILIDRQVQAEFKEQLETERAVSLEKLTAEVPPEVRPVKVWKKVPKDLTGVVEGTAPQTIKVRDRCPCRVLTGKKWSKAVPDCPQCGGKGRVVVRTEVQELPVWRRLEPFNPSSPPQVVKLIKALNLPVPFDRRKGKATTGAKHLKKFVTKAPVFRTLLDCREKNKLLTTYIWETNSQGRIFTHYGFDPSTWRKNSYQYNTQNIPKRSDLAQRFRQMIVAPPGHVLIEFDSSAIEAVLVGYFGGSERYMRLAKVGVHDWVTSCKVGKPIPLDLPFEELKARCKAIKKEYPNEREMIKRVVHLSNYCGTPARIFEEYPEYFRNEKEAADLQGLYFETEAGRDVVAWQRKTIDIAHKEHVLKTPFGYWHYFFNVMSYDKVYRKWRRGDDAKRAVAFRPQATASAIQTEIILWLRDHHPDLLAFLRLIIHDALVAEVPEGLVEVVGRAMNAAFTQGWKELGGLSIGAEGKWGRNLGERSSTNPDGLRPF